VAILTWWSVNAFIPTVAAGLATKWAANQHLAADAVRQLGEEWKRTATNRFNLGGLIGTFLAIPIAKQYGRRALFLVYFLVAGLSILTTFGLDLAPAERLWGYFFIGLSVQGVFGCFTFFLPELFPTRLRATGSGFCYNAGRFVAALGPFLVGSIAALGANAEDQAVRVLFWVGIIPLLGILVLPWVVETKGRPLADQ
jgi:cyanate permease